MLQNKGLGVVSQKVKKDVLPAEAGVQVFLYGSRPSPGRRLDPGACPGLDPGFAGVKT